MKALISFICLLCLWLMISSAHAQTPVQICTTKPTSTDSTALMGCPRTNVVFAVPKLATDLLRVQTPASWVAYGSITASMKLSSASSWNTATALGIPLLPPTTTPVTPPDTPVTCADNFVTLNYSCSISADKKTVTCTAPVPTSVQP